MLRPKILLGQLQGSGSRSAAKPNNQLRGVGHFLAHVLAQAVDLHFLLPALEAWRVAIPTWDRVDTVVAMMFTHVVAMWNGGLLLVGSVWSR